MFDAIVRPLLAAAALSLLAPLAVADGVSVRNDGTLAGSPFPSNRYTVFDGTQNSLRRVQLQGRQRALYESVRVAADTQVRRVLARQGFAGAQISILDALLKLRQVCCDPFLVKGRQPVATIERVAAAEPNNRDYQLNFSKSLAATGNMRSVPWPVDSPTCARGTTLALNVTCPCGGVNFTAFESRL